jgi:hypothetical protein
MAGSSVRKMSFECTFCFSVLEMADAGKGTIMQFSMYQFVSASVAFHASFRSKVLDRKGNAEMWLCCSL